MIKEPNILVIGDIMLDIYISGIVERLSPEATCPILSHCKNPDYKLGGAANVAYILSKSSFNVSLCGMIGNDLSGSKIVELSNSAEINLKHLYTTENSSTTKLRYLTEDNQQLLRIDNDIFCSLPIDVVQNLLNDIENDKFDIIIFSDYDKGVLQPELCQNIISICTKKEIPTIVDIKRNAYNKFRGATLIKGNEGEITGLLKEMSSYTIDIRKSLPKICECMNLKSIVITQGKKGIIGFSTTEGFISYPAKEVPIHDVTGAGDVVISFIAMLFMRHYSFNKTLYLSNLAAQKKVSMVGTSCVSLEDLLKINPGKELDFNKLENIRQLGPIVFTNGCFDILHAGHIDLLREAKKAGNTLIVGLNSDESISRLKGIHRPINDFASRYTVLEALDCVDYIIKFDEDTPIKLIKKIKPDILVKGGDYSIDQVVGSNWVEENGGRVIIIPIVRKLSSTHILEAIGYE